MLASEKMAKEEATDLRPFVTFLNRRQDRERTHRWLDYLSSVDDAESPRSRDTRALALGRLHAMVRAGDLGPPFLQEPPGRSRSDDVDALLSGGSTPLPRRMREAQMDSELLNLQTKQQAELEEVLWEKSQELENLRTDFHGQLQRIGARRLEKEMAATDLERTRERLLMEADAEKEALREELTQRADAHHAGQMQRLRALVEAHVEERQRCQTEHQEALRQMAEDVAVRIDAVKEEYCRRLDAHGDHISKLEADLQKCETRLRTRQKELGCLEDEQEHMTRRERQVGQQLAAMKVKVKSMQERDQLQHEKFSEETSAVTADFRQLLETERTELAAVSRSSSDTKDRLTADLMATKQRLASMEEANAAVMREAADVHRRAIEEIRLSFETRLTDAGRRHESASAILRDKLSSRVDESQSAAAELARAEMEAESARRRAEEEVAHAQARCTVESARQLEAVRHDLETLKEELAASERMRERSRAELDAALRAEQSRLLAEVERERGQMERERANLRVQAARDAEEARLRHEAALEQTAGPLTCALTAADDHGAAMHAANRERLAALRQEEQRWRAATEEAKAARREALLAMGRDRRQDVAAQKQQLAQAAKAERERTEQELGRTAEKQRREKEQLEIQFNRSVEELARRQGGRMEEALSMTSRLDDCIRGLVSINYLLADRLRDVAVAASKTDDHQRGVPAD